MKRIGIFLLTIMFAAMPFINSPSDAADSENGATLYSQSCASCHGSSGEGGIGPTHIGCTVCDSLQSLIDKIDGDMPPSNPGSCTGDCSEDTAAYIYEDFNGYTIGAPEACSLVSPSGDVTEESPSFTWSVVNIATWYKLWIGDGNHRIFRQWYEADECTGTDTCSITPDISLPDGDWTWMVKTWNEDGTGPWSDTLSISVSTGLTLPSAATLVSPNSTTTNYVSFSWNAVSDATYYYLWVDNENGANQIKKWYTAGECGCGSGESTCGITTDVSLDAGSHTWYIQTWNDIGFGPWSSGLSFTVDSGSGSDTDWPDLEATLYVSGFNQPMHLAHGNDGSNLIYVAEKSGYIQVVDNGTIQSTPFLDLSSRLYTSGFGGIQSIEFAPDYSQSGRFYVYYTLIGDAGVTARISRFERDATNPLLADASSEQIILDIDYSEASGLYGGKMAFSPGDGYLYIATGCGSTFSDTDYAQDTGSLLGKVLRIDVSGNSAGYSIPSDNPYSGVSGYSGEIYALGLRNPFGLSFDSETGDLYVVDAGTDYYDEVNYLSYDHTGGANFGWRILEGDDCYGAETCSEPTDYVEPAAAFDFPQQSISSSVLTGGTVYRGSDENLDGLYIAGEYGETGVIIGMKQSSGSSSFTSNDNLASTGLYITHMAQDEDGDLYAVAYLTGALYTVTSSDSTSESQGQED